MTYNLFISHSWTYSDQYEKLIDLLREKTYFDFRDYSVPKDDPLHTSTSVFRDILLENAIEEKMKPASCVLILAGVYSTYSKWINIEIELAKKLNKRIIAIEPWGMKKTSTIVKENAEVIVGWNTNSIVEAIKG